MSTHRLLNAPRARAIMDRLGLDALIATTAQNVLYLSDYRGFSNFFQPATQIYAILTRDLDAAAVTPISQMDMVPEYEAAVETTRGQIYSYGRFYIDPPAEGVQLDRKDQLLLEYGVGEPTWTAPLDLLVELLERKGLAGGRLGVDERGLLPELWRQLERRLPQARIEPAFGTIQQIRMVKTPEEVRRLKEATRITERAMLAALDAREIGMTERAMAQVFEKSLIDQGASPLFTVIAFGTHAAYPNGLPGERRLQRGDLIRFDIGCDYQGYKSDIARTAIIGEPNEKQRRYYQAILDGEDVCLAHVKAGVTASEIFEVTTRAVREAGIPQYRRQHVGHGVGLEVYDPPTLAPGVETPLESGMVFEVETPYYELGFGGIQVEDTIVITDEGYEMLTGVSPRELIVLDA